MNGECDELWSEVWDGNAVPLPIYENEHQDVLMGIVSPIHEIIQRTGNGSVRASVVVSNRGNDYLSIYRIPDGVAYLRSNPAVNHDTHWTGGPDFLVEVLSPGEKAYAKFDFYAATRTREILLVFRNPWRLELHRLNGDAYESAGGNDLGDGAVLASEALPLTFHLQKTATRPAIVIRHTEDGRVWEG